MIVNFSLNTQREIIWSLPGTDIVLTMADSSGSADLSKLNANQRQILAKGINSGRLISDMSASDIADFSGSLPDEKTQEKKRIEAQRQYTQQNGTQKRVDHNYARENSDQLATLGNKLLSGKVVSVKKEIINTNDIRLLKMMHALESGNKKRKTVLALLEGRLSEVTDQVAKSVSDDSNPVNMPKRRRELITYDTDVVEYEDKTVKIDPQNVDMNDLF